VETRRACFAIFFMTDIIHIQRISTLIFFCVFRSRNSQTVRAQFCLCSDVNIFGTHIAHNLLCSKISVTYSLRILCEIRGQSSSMLSSVKRRSARAISSISVTVSSDTMDGRSLLSSSRVSILWSSNNLHNFVTC